MIYLHGQKGSLIKRDMSTALFGNGTLRLTPSVYLRHVRLTIEGCLPSEIGSTVRNEDVFKKEHVIELKFTKTQSIDVLIEKLEYLKSVLKQEGGV